MYLNKAQLYGNLTSDPELKSLPSGVKVVSFGLATNRTYKDKDGNKKDTAEFHNIVAFAKPAELIAQYMKKGRPLYVEGRLQTRSWDDKATGAKKYRTEIVVENFQFGPQAQGGAGSAGGSYASRSESPTSDSTKPARTSGGGADKIDTIEYPTEEINPEDIPF